VRTARRRLERLLRRLAPLLLLLLEFLRLLPAVLLQRPLELGTRWCLPLLSFLQRRPLLLPWLLPRLLLTLLLLLLLLLLDRVEPDRPRCPPRNGGGLDLLVHGTAVHRRETVIRENAKK